MSINEMVVSAAIQGPLWTVKTSERDGAIQWSPLSAYFPSSAVVTILSSKTCLTFTFSKIWASTGYIYISFYIVLLFSLDLSYC